MADSSFSAPIPPEPSDSDSEDGEYNPQRTTRRLVTRASSGSTRRRRRRRTATPVPHSPDVDETQESEGGGDHQPVNVKSEEDEGKDEGDQGRNGGKASVGCEDTSMDDLGVCRCPICMEYWSSTGTHRVCCLPCGHLYGRSCINRWIDQCGRNDSSCPQCKTKCKAKDIRNLYAQKIAAVDEELQQEVISLRAENEVLKVEKKRLLEEVYQLKNISNPSIIYLEGTKKKHILYTLEGRQMQTHIDQYFGSDNIQRSFDASSCHFLLQNELVLDGARVFDMDTHCQVMVVSSKPSVARGDHILKKLSLLVSSEQDLLRLPANTGAVKDLHISPQSTNFPGRLILLASLGKKLSVVSLENNNAVVTYNLQAPAWSCAWDLNDSNYVYVGLQNGLLLIFDLRQTMHPVQTVGGLSSHPVHTVHSIGSQGLFSGNSGDKMFLSASAVGPCMCSPGNLDNWSGVVPGLEDQGVCISLAHCSLSNDVVASFRPKISAADEGLSSQSSAPPSTSISEPVKSGRHFLIKKNNAGVYAVDGCFTGNVSGLRLPKSAIIGLANNKSLFTYGDETRCCLGVWDLQRLNFVSFLRPHQQPILDVKYARSTGAGLLGCISDSMFQLYTCY
ncbi:E3 ubiquitin-protein ligase [Nymphaea thermarum]|nr:E3 ubiquitin-protein ligase [Nymphaea thermarum]